MLNQAREGKAKALRVRIRNEPLNGNRSGLRIELLKVEDRYREYQRTEKEALSAIEKRANELGLTTVKDKDGDVRLSITRTTKDRRISFADASAIVDKISIIAKKGWNLDIILVASHDALPENVKAAITKDYGEDTKAKGVVHDGIAYIVVDEHTSQADIEETILHEIKGHVGIRHAPLLSPRTLRGYQRPAPLTRFHHQVDG